VGVLHLGPPLPGFQQPFFRAGAVFPAAPQLGMSPFERVVSEFGKNRTPSRLDRT